MATCFTYLHTIRKQKDDKQTQKYCPQETRISIHAKLYAAFLVERFSCKVITRNSTISPTVLNPLGEPCRLLNRKLLRVTVIITAAIVVNNIVTFLGF